MSDIPQNIIDHMIFINSEMEKEITKKSDLKGNKRFWNIFKLHYKRNRYIYDEYKNGRITDTLYYELCNTYLDKSLIAKWRKPGYEKLCCLRCIQRRESKFGNVCICRVPKCKRNEISCDFCGCKGCSG
ncbi:Pre-mRNA-splicing factor cwf14 [Dictyocoela muelleri]|nr:Pre-mRNA-splicing factor cwf14 [Dictyocoela muelleri]